MHTSGLVGWLVDPKPRIHQANNQTRSPLRFKGISFFLYRIFYYVSIASSAAATKGGRHNTLCKATKRNRTRRLRSHSHSVYEPGDTYPRQCTYCWKITQDASQSQWREGSHLALYAARTNTEKLTEANSQRWHTHRRSHYAYIHTFYIHQLHRSSTRTPLHRRSCLRMSARLYISCWKTKQLSSKAHTK